MPIMVQRANYDTWPFAVWELELHSLEDEAYEDGWIDPRLGPPHTRAGGPTNDKWKP